MSDITSPAAPPDTATAPDTAATPAVDRSPNARRERAIAAIESTPYAGAKSAEPEGEAETEAAPEAAKATPQVDDREERIRAKLQEQRTARETKQREEAQRRYEAEGRELLRKQTEQRSQPTAAELIAELKRDPVGTRRKYGIDPRADLDTLTQELLNPGYSAQSGGVDELRQQLKQTQEQIQADRQAQQEEREQYAIHQRRQQFVAQTGDEKRWPLLSKLDPEDRLEEGVLSWQTLAPQGADYDPELIADAAEARLSRRAKKWQPAAADPKPEPTAAAAPKPRARTITPALASDTGASANLSREQRRAKIVANLERRSAAR